MVHWGAKCFVLRNCLWKFVNQLDWSPGTFSTTETFLIFAKYSFWQTLNIRHSQGLWRIHVEVQKDHHYCTKLLHNMYTKNINNVLCGVISVKHHGIFLVERQKKSIKVGCLRPRWPSLFVFIPEDRPALDLTVPLGVHFLKGTVSSEWVSPLPRCTSSSGNQASSME